jgi:hypothetical protein
VLRSSLCGTLSDPLTAHLMSSCVNDTTLEEVLDGNARVQMRTIVRGQPASARRSALSRDTVRSRGRTRRARLSTRPRYQPRRSGSSRRICRR